jgi:hypothetical protein
MPYSIIYRDDRPWLADDQRIVCLLNGDAEFRQRVVALLNIAEGVETSKLEASLTRVDKVKLAYEKASEEHVFVLLSDIIEKL